MNAATARGSRLAAPRELVKVYVWQLPVRMTHWLIVLSIAVLSVTGIYIGHPFLVVPGPAGSHFVMGTMRAIHFGAAIVFTLSVLARVYWMFAGNVYARWDQFLPIPRKRRRGIVGTLRFYLFGLRKPPGFIGHNPVAGLTYTLVFGLYFIEILTGLVMYSPDARVGSPLHAFGALAPLFGGLVVARWIHHAILWLLIGFAVHHVYSATLMSHVEANATMESMFSGYKFVKPEDLVFSKRHFVDKSEVADA